MDRLSTEIYRIIQSYLSSYSYYINLLNTSKSIFQWIKYETRYYQLVIRPSYTWPEQRPSKYMIFNLIRKVKNPSRQISLTFIKVPYEKSIVLFLQSFRNIHHVHIHELHIGYCATIFDFSIFGDVKKIQISLNYGITSIFCSKPMEYTERIELSSFHGLKQLALSCRLTYQLRISLCCHLQTIIPESNIIKMELIQSNLNKLDIQLSDLKSILPDSALKNRSTPMNSNDAPTAVSKVTMEIRSTLDNINPDNYNWMKQFISNIQILDLQRTYTLLPFIILPFIFQGIELSLHGFTLREWNSECLPNVQKIVLDNCDGIVDFPHLPKAKEIELTAIQNLAQFSWTFPSCEKLVISDCEWLEDLTLNEDHSSNTERKKRVIDISDCALLRRVRGITGFQHVKVYHNLPALEEIEEFGHHQSMQIKAIPSLASAAQAFLCKHEIKEELLKVFQSIEHLTMVKEGNGSKIARDFW